MHRVGPNKNECAQSFRCTGERVSRRIARNAYTASTRCRRRRGHSRVDSTNPHAQRFHVDAARDGAEAIENILQQDYDVIVLDLMMPRIDGFAVAEYLQRNRPEILSRVIVVTAYGPSGLERVRPLVDECIEKPFEVSGLAKKAKAILDRARQPEDPQAESAESDDGHAATAT